ncbi:MAG TPA: amidase [Candidatus Dormibacteraeota bacterium]|nr:amidase [Candidatus Dormibacteraeota bacterium]
MRGAAVAQPGQSLRELVDAMRRGQLSPVELTDDCLARARQHRALQAFITEPGDATRRQARRAQQRPARKEPRALLGVPIAIKDLFQTRGLRTTGGSRILRSWVPAADAAAVARLRSAGAIIFGKTNLHEFAYGVTTANPWWGIARNPHNPQRSPGGSSGGSAIAVVTGMAAGALGSDTGGSIRIPAALCGCVGLKPTYGAIPLAGTIPLGPSLDHAGPMARSVDDVGLLFDVLTNSSRWEMMRRSRRQGLARTRIGVLRGNILQPALPAILREVDRVAGALKRQGLAVREMQIPELTWTVAAQLVTLRAEASASHARWLRSRPSDYGRDVRLRLQLGTVVSGSDYLLAQRMRARLREALRRAFDQVDLLLLPTTPITAPVIGTRTVRWPAGPEPVDGALVRLTAPFNLTGVPALSIPGRPDDDGLPIGIQVVGRWDDEPRVLAIGRLVEELSK